jgi:hypothetical protein
MPALFTLPKTIPLSSGGLLLPGAKLTFSATGTSTLQNTYQDVLLATPHANPVVADAAGVFAPIYLDPSLPNYRVKLTTSADVLVYQVDDVPSNQNEAQTFKLTSAAPELVFNETDATANNKKWRIRAQSEQLLIELLNDAESVATAIATITRVGTTSPVLNFGSGFLTIAGLTAATFQAEFFTATFTGMTGATSGQLLGVRWGPGLCMLSGTTAITGTSNNTAMSFTGVPSAYRAAASTTVFGLMVDNGVTKGGLCTVTSAGAVNFGIGIDGTTTFTGSGTKGIPARWSLLYSNA